MGNFSRDIGRLEGYLEATLPAVQMEYARCLIETVCACHSKETIQAFQDGQDYAHELLCGEEMLQEEGDCETCICFDCNGCDGECAMDIYGDGICPVSECVTDVFDEDDAAEAESIPCLLCGEYGCDCAREFEPSTEGVEG